MLSIFCLFFLAIIQKFSFAQDTSGYVLDSDQPLELTEANLKILSFRLLNNWVDITLEYSQSSGSGGADAQWFGIGFGNTRMQCTYAITFEPKLESDNDTISSVTITERQLGNHEPGRELARRLSYVETHITQNPLAVIRARLIRQRLISSSGANNSDCSENPTGYYQFPFNNEDISIIFAKGVNGALSVSYHDPNKNTGSIPLRAATSEEANVSIPTNTTMSTCPKPFALRNYTYAERFNSPYIGRVCGSCSNNNINSTNEPVTIIPISTSISGISSLVLNGSDSDENNFQCMTFNVENDSYPNPPVCGCANELSPNVSIVLLVDCAGNQNDSDWEQFTWKILEGFFLDVMLNDMNTSAITTNSTNFNLTMNNTILENLDVNVVLYGGSYPLQVQKLDWNFLQNISVDPVPKSERFISNLCNATLFAADYLMNSNQSVKILVTIPWQDASDELDCLTCKNCTLNGINTFTAKIFDKVDLSLVESTFGGYSNCTYLYENETEMELHNLQEWPYVLGGISDFICITSQIVMPEINFSLELLMECTIPPQQLNSYLVNISYLIEEAFENVSNYSLEAEEDFYVECLSINETDIALPPLPQVAVPTFTVIIENVVHCANDKVKDILVTLAQGSLFSKYLNHSFYTFFQSINGFAVVYVFSVDNVTIFNLTFVTTEIQSTTMLPSSLLSSTNIFNMNTSFIMATEVSGGDVFDKARRFVMRLAPWMIALIVIGAVVVCLLLVGSLALCCNRRNRDCEKEENSKEQMPMIVTNTVASQYIETTKSNQHLKRTTASRVPEDEDDQIYV